MRALENRLRHAEKHGREGGRYGQTMRMSAGEDAR